MKALALNDTKESKFGRHTNIFDGWGDGGRGIVFWFIILLTFNTSC